jgi:hypothetical protein
LNLKEDGNETTDRYGNVAFPASSASAFAGQVLADEARKESQTISWTGSQPSVKGSSEYFTGNVRIDPLFPAKDSAPF